MKKVLLLLAMLVLSLGIVSAEVNSVTPSTNDENKDLGWAHVNVLEATTTNITFEFVQPRTFLACFEYRTDGDTSQAYAGYDNYNPLVTDGLYPFFCLNNNNRIETITANEYIEIRMVFGAESDERFDWTRFDVLLPPTKAEILLEKGVPGKGILNAPGLQKESKKDNFANI